MPTIKLTPSTYYLSNSSYLSVSNASNMYSDTDSTTYATVTNSRTSTTSYYAYIRGFNFDAVPSGAIVNSFTIKVKCNYSGGYSSGVYLFDGTSQSYGDSGSDFVSSTVKVIEISTTHTWDELVSCGSDLGLRINCRRSSRNTTAYIYIYGAEIDVDYTLPTPATVTSTLNGDGTISPSGATSTYEGAEYTLTITPTDKTATVMVTNNGADVTNQLVAHRAGDTLSLAPNDVTTSGVQSGASYMEYAVGHTAESPSSSGTSSNAYASSGSTGYAAYSFDLSAIPSGATIEAIEASVYGHRENASIDSTHVSQCAIYNGSTAISKTVDFPSTSNSTIELEATTIPSSLSNVTVRHTVGYYGGLVLGITLRVTYSIGSGIDHYTYTFTVSADATIAVIIGGAAQPKFFVKLNGAWTAVSKVYEKVNGAWVERSDPSTVFDTSANYVHGS